jgi:hypothetical protein
MTLTIKKLTLIAFLGALVACGGGDDPAAIAEETTVEEDIANEAGVDAEDVITDTASDVTTTPADMNGFILATDIQNPHSYDAYGNIVNITAYVKDHSNNNVEDGTVVTFIADDNGLIANQCVTVDGRCSVEWVGARDRNYDGDFRATIMASTIGEDSFIDKNSNSLFDDGEIFFTQSEAFLDADDDGTYDDGFNDFDEFLDFNNNGAFDLNVSPGLFRGVSCSAAAISAGHCAVRNEIWDSITMINSAAGAAADGKAVRVSFTDCNGNTVATVALTTAASKVCVEFTDINGNIPPVGTEYEYTMLPGLFLTEPGEEIPNRYAAPGTGYVEELSLIESSAVTLVGSLSVKTTSKFGVINTASIVVSQ